MAEPAQPAPAEPAVAAPAPAPAHAGGPALAPAPSGAMLAALGGRVGPVAFTLQLARRPATERAAVVGALHRSAGNAAVTRLLQRQEASVAPPPEPSTTETWQHPEVRAKAAATEKTEQKAKPKDRGLELYMELVPAVVRAVKGYSTADGRQVPLENAMLIIAQASAEHAPYDPARAQDPVVPAGSMLWGVTSASTEPGATVSTTTPEEKQGQRVLEQNRKFRAYGSLEEAAVGYLKALEGVDPNAAQNPSYKAVLDALTTKGTTPEQFGALLDSVHYATASTYGTEVAANAKEGRPFSAKRMVKKFMPQIKQGQQDKIDALQARQESYRALIEWIDERAGEVADRIAALDESTGELEELQAELDQLKADRVTAEEAAAALDPKIEKEQQLLTDIEQFAGTLGKDGG